LDNTIYNIIGAVEDVKTLLSRLGNLDTLELGNNPDLKGCPKNRLDGPFVKRFLQHSNAMTLVRIPVTGAMSKFFVLLALPLAYANLITDIIQAIQFVNAGYTMFFAAQIVLIVIPTVVNLSLLTGCDLTSWAVRCFIICQCSIIYETYEAFDSLTTTTQILLLKVIETVLESYPSVLLQLIFLITSYYQPETSQAAVVSLVISIVIAIVSTSMTFATVRKSYIDRTVISSSNIKIFSRLQTLIPPKCILCKHDCTFDIGDDLQFECWACGNESTKEWERWRCKNCKQEFCKDCFVPEGSQHHTHKNDEHEAKVLEISNEVEVNDKCIGGKGKWLTTALQDRGDAGYYIPHPETGEDIPVTTDMIRPSMMIAVLYII